MKFTRRHWYNLALPIAAFAVMWIFFGHLNLVQVILLLNFVALALHQFEEYAWPGGEPWIINEAMMPSGSRPDRYPLNQNNAFIINVPMAWTFYLLPVFFPDRVWLGLAPTVFGFAQFGMHGIATNKKLKTLYNPGLAAVVLGHIPLGIWYLVTVYSKSMITLWDWVFGILYMVLFASIGMKIIGYGLLADKDSAYPFASEEMERFNRSGHLARFRMLAGPKN
jgi:uncharacterized protein with HXXEE motif